MQIEKVNNNKLKVILNTNDLEENHIDLNTFMANSLESQDLFFNILDLAEEKFDFYVDDSKLVIEAISLANNLFIFTITKLSDCKDIDSPNSVYCFENFDEICNMSSFLGKDILHHLYTYNHKFYLIMNKNNKSNYMIDEFANSKINSPCLENILMEYGIKCAM